ncbi:hypothetical protein [Brevibacillus daliensis]|uniref:hypothetical protein n=1 Tax=Brevibacillus daliensis TaxID=2892995 RepID=UPI001E30A79C|nr:hypothetical protein [Brevibacillus daliensis]
MFNKNSLKIGIDIDGTVTHPASLVPFLNKAFGKNLALSDCYQYNLATIYEISDEEFDQWLLGNSREVYSNSGVHGTAGDILRNWSSVHELIYISARQQSDMEVTTQWFTDNQIPFHQIDLIGCHNKLEAARNRQVQLFMEDRLENALQLAEELYIPVILFNTPYNQATLPELVHRVHHWDEAASLVHQISLERK